MQKSNLKRIVYKDRFLAIVNKCCGEDSQIFFKEMFKEQSFVETANRLDKPVSGLLIVCFSRTAHTRLTELFKQNKIRKEYWAICKKTETFKLNNIEYAEEFITFNTKQQKAFICKDNKRKNNNKAKKASLFFELVGLGRNYNFFRIFPVTGRTHQIRVQLAHLGICIKGDIKYGAKRTEKDGGVRLHSALLEFIHPIFNKTVRAFALPIKSDNVWDACIKYCIENI